MSSRYATLCAITGEATNTQTVITSGGDSDVLPTIFEVVGAYATTLLRFRSSGRMFISKQ